jgi:Tfp pilus assembly protein PilV
MSAARGSSVIEALVALALAGITMVGLAAAATGAVANLRRARARDTAVALASSQLEALRAGPRADGSDVVGPFVRRWWVDDGRGDAAAVDVEVAWDARVVRLESEVSP